MELTAELLLEAKFSPARRGYDMNEVDDFLERCAEGLDVLMGRLRAEFERAERAEEEVRTLRAQLEGRPAAVPDAPPEVEAPEPLFEPDAAAEAEPEAPQPEAAPPAPTISADEPMRILIAAERTAESTIAEARTEAGKITADAETAAAAARREADGLLTRARTEAEAEARRAGQTVRREIEAEVTTLRQDREMLDNDVRTLQRWLDDQRARLRTAARDLQRIVEDPAALRELPTPQLRDAASETDPADDALAESAEHDSPSEAGNAFDGEPTAAVPVFDADEDDSDR